MPRGVLLGNRASGTLYFGFLGGLAFEEIDDDPAGFVSYTRLVVRL
jgi:hypothetical protein